jgi:NADH-quinone oxidoreductase subunit N
MSELYRIPQADVVALLPELILSGTGVLILMLDAFAPAMRRLLAPIAALGTLLAGWQLVTRSAAGSSFGGLLESTPLTVAIGCVVLISTLLAVLASDGYLRRERLGAGEYYALLLWCATGVLLMGRATELITIFVALELLSICLYSLAGYHRRLSVSTEAAIKYFLLGAFVSSFVLYGIALVYGETGSTQLSSIGDALVATNTPPLATLGVLLLVCGFAFKMSIAPFHAWAPDAYQGAPSPFVAFLSVAPKAASAVVLVRILAEVLPSAGIGSGWRDVIALLAVLSMAVGNLLALAQRDIKRMLAYSGIAHMGYLLVPMVTLGPNSYEPIAIYLLAYALMNAGAFTVVSLLYSEPGEQHLISELSGWGYRYPLLGVCLTICMLSLGGIPPTLGFIGKYLIFIQAIDAGQMILALVIVVTSLIGVYYYLRVVYTLYMRPEVREPSAPLPDGLGRLAATLAALAILVLGTLPGPLLDWAKRIADGNY